MKFKRLDVWKAAFELSCQICEISKYMNDFGFKDQITRAGLSVPSNIAEGVEREHVKDQIKFFNIAKSSLAEVVTQLNIGVRVGFIETNKGRDLEKLADRTGAMLAGLIKHKKSQQNLQIQVPNP